MRQVSFFLDIQVPSSASAFSHQPKAIIGPHTTENIKVSNWECNNASNYLMSLKLAY